MEPRVRRRRRHGNLSEKNQLFRPTSRVQEHGQARTSEDDVDPAAKTGLYWSRTVGRRLPEVFVFIPTSINHFTILSSYYLSISTIVCCWKPLRRHSETYLILGTFAYAVRLDLESMASGAMANQLPNIRISSSGGAENPDSYSTNHVEVDFITPKVKARGPAEGAVTFAK